MAVLEVPAVDDLSGRPTEWLADEITTLGRPHRRRRPVGSCCCSPSSTVGRDTTAGSATDLRATGWAGRWA